MKKLLVRNQGDYKKVIDFLQENDVVISEDARAEILSFPERNELSMIVAYEPKSRRVFAGEHDLKYEITDWAESFDDLFNISKSAKKMKCKFCTNQVDEGCIRCVPCNEAWHDGFNEGEKSIKAQAKELFNKLTDIVS